MSQRPSNKIRFQRGYHKIWLRSRNISLFVRDWRRFIRAQWSDGTHLIILLFFLPTDNRHCSAGSSIKCSWLDRTSTAAKSRFRVQYTAIYIQISFTNSEYLGFWCLYPTYFIKEVVSSILYYIILWGTGDLVQSSGDNIKPNVW